MMGDRSLDEKDMHLSQADLTWRASTAEVPQLGNLCSQGAPADPSFMSFVLSLSHPLEKFRDDSRLHASCPYLSSEKRYP